MRDETAQGVEHRHDLRGMTVSMSGDGGPDQRHRQKRMRVMSHAWQRKDFPNSTVGVVRFHWGDVIH